jgi:hypothetical protein
MAERDAGGGGGSQDGEMRMWALTIKVHTEDTDSAHDIAHYAAKKPSRTEKAVSWRYPDYREQMLFRRPFCLSILPRSQHAYLVRTFTVRTLSRPDEATCHGSRLLGRAPLELVASSYIPSEPVHCVCSFMHREY